MEMNFGKVLTMEINEQIIKLREQGLGWRSISKELSKQGVNLSYIAVRKRYLKVGEPLTDTEPQPKEEVNIPTQLSEEVKRMIARNRR
jgi:site-specific recombinase XerC